MRYATRLMLVLITIFYSLSALATQLTINGDLIPNFSNPSPGPVFPSTTPGLPPDAANGVAGASRDGGFDAFDTYGYYSGSSNGLTRSLTHRRQAIAQEGNIFQWLDTFTNDSSSNIDTTVEFVGRLGSGHRTFIEYEDPFTFVTSDSLGGDPVIAHVLGNNDFAANNMHRSLIGNLYSVQADLSLAPGESASLLMQAFLARDVTGEYTIVERFNDRQLAIDTGLDLVANAKGFGLTDLQIGSILNFDNVVSATANPVPSSISNIPIPGAIWLFFSAFFGLYGYFRKSTDL